MSQLVFCPSLINKASFSIQVYCNELLLRDTAEIKKQKTKPEISRAALTVTSTIKSLGAGLLWISFNLETNTLVWGIFSYYFFNNLLSAFSPFSGTYIICIVDFLY